MNQDDSHQPRHPIRVVSQRTTLSVEVLRAWERRYGVVTPSRSETGQRLYSDADVSHLRLLRQATEHGRSIGHVAALSTAELSALLQEDAEQQPARGEAYGPATASAPAEPHLQTAQSAVRALNAPRLEAALMRALVTLSAESFLDHVVTPLLRMLGQGWVDGSLRVAHEHLAAAVLRRVLGLVVDSAETPPGAPVLVAATPARQVHEFGALLAAAAAAAQGWRVIYLGPDLPAHEIAYASRETGARAIALSLVYSTDEASLGDELRRLRQEVGEEVELLVGGAAAAEYAGVLAEVGARRLSDLAGLRLALHRLAGPATNGLGRGAAHRHSPQDGEGS